MIYFMTNFAILSIVMSVLIHVIYQFKTLYSLNNMSDQELKEYDADVEDTKRELRFWGSMLNFDFTKLIEWLENHPIVSGQIVPLVICFIPIFNLILAYTNLEYILNNKEK